MQMRKLCRLSRHFLILATSVATLNGCMSLPVRERNSLAGIGFAAASQIPSTDIEQVYYLGVFDPQDQLPPTIYRVRVRGQASAINQTRYASGWVRAELIDSLSTVARFDDQSKSVRISPVEEEVKGISNGRRLVMFGPEGFREAPKDHRLVIVMGSSPEKFFSGIDEALGVLASATQGFSGPQLEQSLFRELTQLRNQKSRLEAIRSEPDTLPGVAK
jgi:hypothetical protein